MRYQCVDREVELALLRGVQAGDEAAFDAVYAAFNARLFGFLARLTRRRDVAEDLLEETWLRFVRHAARLEPDTQIGAWLFTVARNLHVSYCRTRHAESAGGHLGLWPVRAAESPFESAAQTQFQERVDAALAALPVTLREAILLVGVEGLPSAEAATICGISADAMRQRVRRGRMLLASRLGYTLGDLRRASGA